MATKIKAAPWGAAIATLELAASQLQNERGMSSRMNELLAAANTLKNTGRWPHSVKMRIEGLAHAIKTTPGIAKRRGLKYKLEELKGLQAECTAPSALEQPPVDNAHVAAGCEKFCAPIDQAQGRRV